MPKTLISLRMDPTLLARLKSWGKSNDRTLAYAIEESARLALPSMEDETTPPIKYSAKKSTGKSRSH